MSRPHAPFAHWMGLALMPGLIVFAFACRSGERGAGGASAAAGPVRVATIAGFDIPESVIHDPDQDVYFVSNIRGGALAKDDNGFISRVRPDGSVEDRKFIEGGRAGVTLHAPKGTAIAGDTLWVADIDAVRGFDKRTGAPLATVDLSRAGALFLNDVALGPDGALYVTDTGFRAGPGTRLSHSGPDRIYRIGPVGEVSIALQADTLAGPNGILWDAEENRFLVASLRGPTIFAWRPEEAAPAVVAIGPGGFDGLARTGDGRLLVSSLSASTVFALAAGKLEPLIEDVSSPADIGVDTRRNRVLIPTLAENRVEIWELRRPSGGGR